MWCKENGPGHSKGTGQKKVDMKKITFILMMFFCPSLFAATLTSNTVPYVCQGGSSPQLCDSSVTTDSTGDIYSNSGGWQDYSARSTIVGWSSLGSGLKYIYYKKVGKIVFVNFYLYGTSNNTIASFTVPYTAATSPGYTFVPCETIDNGVNYYTGYVNIQAGYNVVNIGMMPGGKGFTASGNKYAFGQFWYQSI